MGSYLLEMSMVLQLFTAERKLVYIESKDVFRDWNDVPVCVGWDWERNYRTLDPRIANGLVVKIIFWNNLFIQLTFTCFSGEKHN